VLLSSQLIKVLPREDHHVQADERRVELIAARVTAALRDELETVLAALAAPATSAQTLTVKQLAARLGVARSTVYAHWREWGGYKLGNGQKPRSASTPTSSVSRATPQHGHDPSRPSRTDRPAPASGGAAS